MNKVQLPYTDPSERFSSASLPAVPPFGMRNVTCRAFPLRADMAALNAFCDRYLNMDIPPTIAHFRPTLPYVYFLALDYGSMSPESIGMQNMGWVAQHEMLFMVPLQRWREENGKLVFKDWACVSPFIFVDDAMSQRTGREVYGWPKVLGEITPDVPAWVSDPRAATRLFTMSVKVFPKSYAGEQQLGRPLVSVDLAPPARLSELPINTANPLGLFSSINQFGTSAVQLGTSALDILLGLRLRGNRTNRTADNMLRMFGDIASKAALSLPDVPWWPTEQRGGVGGNKQALSIEQITLKQFRDVANPRTACYQALVSSPMAIDSLNAGGFLGDTNLLLGDASGGYTVNVHRYDSQPIIEALGLKVYKETEDVDGSKVAVLKPILPFWTDVDLHYGEGSVLCSRVPPRFPDEPVTWRDEKAEKEQEREQEREQEKEEEKPESNASEPEPELMLGELFPTELAPDEIPYNTARGAATQPISGPFHFPDMTLQLYPLLADKECMQESVDRYLNDILSEGDDGGSGYRFEVLGEYAYLMTVLCSDEEGTMWSEVNDIGWWAERQVSFNIPVKWFKDDEFHSLAMVSPFVFANSSRAVLTDREVNGREAVQADIESDSDVWFSETSGPVKPRNMLCMSTNVFPAMNMGQRSEKRTLLKIDEHDVLPWNDVVGWRLVAEQWGEDIVAELHRLTATKEKYEEEICTARALATSILCNEQPVNWINLKQYRDTDSSHACYQSLVHSTWAITDIYDVREIKERLHVHLYRYPGQPIAKTLGLKEKCTYSADGGVVQSFQPMRPFFMRVAIREDLGQELCWRTNEDATWVRDRSEQVPRTRSSKGPPGFFVKSGSSRAVRTLGDLANKGWGARQRLTDTVNDEMRVALRSDLQSASEIAQVSDPTGETGMAERIASIAAQAEEMTVEELYKAVEELVNSDDIYESKTRVSFDSAQQAIEKLDELQLVIGSILTERWADWGNPSDEKNDPTPPECCIREDSIDWHEERKIWQQRHNLAFKDTWATPVKNARMIYPR
ncbi:MAG: hypothetical protein GKR90_13325 [Pseudomonadales bacterium]|nr:hypothetical protein [Pseudomonadales bacterium]